MRTCVSFFLICALALCHVGSVSQAVFFGQNLPASGVTPIALVAHTTSAGVGVSTTAINTAGATLLTLVVGQYYGTQCGGSPADSKSNTWTGVQGYNTSNATICIWYAAGPAVGAGHTVSYSGSYNTIAFAAWSNVVATSPYDTGNVGGTTGMSVNTGAATPAANNELCLAGGTELTIPAESSWAFASPAQAFTLLDTVASVYAVNVGLADGYFVQTTAASLSTTYTIVSTGGVVPMVAALACFKHA